MDKDSQKPVAPPTTVLTGVRKRQQIEMTNKRIFLWVAVASVIVSFSLIALQFLVKEFLFNQKIIDAKNKTNGTLIENIQTAKQLKENVNKLLADENLAAVERVDDNVETSNLNLILDALPVSGDATGFANSLQTVVLPRSGVSIDKLDTNVDLTQTDESLQGDTATTSDTGPQPLPFSVSFGGNFNQVNQVFGDMARVIRPISVSHLELNASDSTLLVTVNGVTYFAPAKTVNITQESITP